MGMHGVERVGIIGLTEIGVRFAERLHDEWDVGVVGADASRDARAAFEREFGGETFDTPEALCESDVEAVFVATPNRFHAQPAIAAFEAGLDVYMAKPLAHTLESAERIAAASERTGRICHVGYYFRYDPAVEILKQYVDSGYLGRVLEIDSKFLRRRGIPGRGTWFTSKEIAGGGALMDLGSYGIDLMLFLLDYPDLADVMATTRAEFGPREDYTHLEMFGEDDDWELFDVEDAVTAMFEFGCETTATLQAKWATNDRTRHVVRVLGSEAGARIEFPIGTEPSEGSELTLFETRNGGTDHFVDSAVRGPDRNAPREQMRRFLESVSTGRAPDHNTVDQALAVQRVIDRTYRAATRSEDTAG